MSLYKQVAPKRVSFVDAVKAHGDYWALEFGIKPITRDALTQDWKDAHRMQLMELGLLPRAREEA
jgi:1,2-phenylacetyl-CoA epoxidase catalytic subunit